MKATFQTKYIQHVSDTLKSSNQVQFRYAKENTPQNYQDWVSLCSQNHVLKLVGKRAMGRFGYKTYAKLGYTGMCVQNVSITLAN